MGCKDKTRERLNESDDTGDAWTFMAIERTTKLVIAYHVGKRTPFDTEWFAEKLRDATTGWFQLSTAGFKPHGTAIPEVLRCRVDFAQLVKIYAGGPNVGQARYSPAEITGIRKRWMLGNPDMEKVCTSHAERQNLNIRMHVRRMTRLTNAFSKKWTNHDAMLSIFFVWYNFCRNHVTLKTTPAVAAGLADEEWSVERLLGELATFC